MSLLPFVYFSPNISSGGNFEILKEDRLKVIDELNKKGIFFVKGAIHLVANSLGISPPTIYRYLEKLKLQARKGKD